LKTFAGLIASLWRGVGLDAMGAKTLKKSLNRRYPNMPVKHTPLKISRRGDIGVTKQRLGKSGGRKARTESVQKQ
jgi:mannitol-specific phosphotransferase system IIBC component